MARIVLGSGSGSRIALLRNAGIVFTARAAPIDERAVEAPLVAAAVSPDGIAMALAEAKALAVSKSEPDALVIGGDQVLNAAERRWNKPADRADARAQLLALGGRSHLLHTAVVVACGGKVDWRHHETARMTMRTLSPEDIDAYLDEVGDAALSSVGAYQIEGPGIRLFAEIEGDYFAILGLPLLPLLAYLREARAL